MRAFTSIGIVTFRSETACEFLLAHGDTSRPLLGSELQQDFRNGKVHIGEVRRGDGHVLALSILDYPFCHTVVLTFPFVVLF